ncbi:transposase [Kitasatospora sp. NPDC059648]|uniref:IS110 family transposase n=1 Tax=Kitasatospora sp. NPDC059648 TaxID=3346894 RepID=UPI00367537AA
MFFGWDWATETHDVTVMDNSGIRADHWALAHTEQGIGTTLRRLRKHEAPADLPVAIETTRGLVVDRLLAAGHSVVPVHPNAFHAMRPRWGASKTKTDAVEAPPYAPLLADMPRIGKINPGQITGEIGPILERAESCEQFIAEAGVVPVTRASGKSRAVTFRVATNRRARIAITTFADNSRHGSDWAAKIYTDARARKKRHPHAIRILTRAWLRVIRACRRDGTCYDPVTRQSNSKTKTASEAVLAA